MATCLNHLGLRDVHTNKNHCSTQAAMILYTAQVLPQKWPTVTTIRYIPNNGIDQNFYVVLGHTVSYMTTPILVSRLTITPLCMVKTPIETATSSGTHIVLTNIFCLTHFCILYSRGSGNETTIVMISVWLEQAAKFANYCPSLFCTLCWQTNSSESMTLWSSSCLYWWREYNSCS